MKFTKFDIICIIVGYSIAIVMMFPFIWFLNLFYPVLEDAKRSEADSTHGEASNHYKKQNVVEFLLTI